MAASLFRISVASCNRVQLSSLRGPVAYRLINPHKILLPASGSATTRKEIHTSLATRDKEERFRLPKNTNEGLLHWKKERYVSAALLLMIPGVMATRSYDLVYPTLAIDHGFAILSPLHMYWGLEAVIGDYVWRPIVPLTKVLWKVLCFGSVVGLLYVNVNDVGVSKLFANIMTL